MSIKINRHHWIDESEYHWEENTHTQNYISNATQQFTQLRHRGMLTNHFTCGIELCYWKYIQRYSGVELLDGIYCKWFCETDMIMANGIGSSTLTVFIREWENFVENCYYLLEYDRV